MAEKGCRDLYHTQCLSKLCRLCGKEAEKYGKRPTEKTKIEDIIRKAFSIDVTEDDPSVVPVYVCDICRMKLQRWKKQKRNNKAHPTLNISLTTFGPHTSPCAICGQRPNLSVVAELGKKVGLLVTTTDNQTNLTKMDKLGITVLCHGSVMADRQCKLYVGPDSRDVLHHHQLENDTTSVEKLIDLLTQRVPCPGNEGFEDIISRRRRSGSAVVVFTGKDGKTVAKEECNTIRHVNCHGLVYNGLCAVCSMYKHTLRKYSQRHSGDADKASYDPNTRSDYLTDSQKKQKISHIQMEKRALKRKLEATEEVLYAEVQKRSLNVSEDLSKGFTDVLRDHKFEEGSLPHIFWQQQMKYHGQKDGRGNRWHPSVIRLCIAIHAKSPAAYQSLKDSGVLMLPSSSTLRDYTRFTTVRPGFNHETILRIVQDCHLDDLDAYKRNAVIAIDEIKIKQGLVFSPASEELLGWVDCGDIDEEISQLIEGDKPRKRKPLATHIQCFMLQGLFLGLNQVLAFFPSRGCNFYQLYFLVWEAVIIMEAAGFRIRAVVSDGASANRAFYKAHGSNSGLVHCSPHPLRDQNLYFLSDVPHLIKLQGIVGRTLAGTTKQGI